MHGIVNKAVKDLVSESFGIGAWKEICIKAGVEDDNFLNNMQYDDQVTYNLVAAASEKLEIPAGKLLEEFGKYWILRTGQENYGGLLKSAGHNFIDFMRYLPKFHSHVMIMFDGIEPPEFTVKEIDQSSIEVKYFSHRNGLATFVQGLFLGIGEMFDTDIIVTQDQHKHTNGKFDSFIIKY